MKNDLELDVNMREPSVCCENKVCNVELFVFMRKTNIQDTM